MALIRVLYTVSPHEVRAGLAACWVYGAAGCGMGTKAGLTAEMMERFI